MIIPTTTTHPDVDLSASSLDPQPQPAPIITSYLPIPSGPSTSSLIQPTSPQLNNSDPPPDGFFDHKAAVIGTFLSLAILLLILLSILIWRLIRTRRHRSSSTTINNHPLGLDLDLQQHPDDHQPLDHALASSFTPNLSHSIDHPLEPIMHETHPVPPNHQTHLTTRSSDLEIMKSEDWSRYINTHFSNLDSIDPSKPINLEDHPTLTHPPQIIIPNELTSTPGFCPETQTVEHENFIMINPIHPNHHYALANDQFHEADQTLVPSMIITPSQDDQYRSSQADEGRHELLSLREDQDHSRRILRVSNPDIGDGEDKSSHPTHHSSP